VKILVIDDDDDVRSVVGRALVGEGHRVETVGSVADARSVLAGDAPDLLVLDLGLPDGSGLALCRELREEGFAFPILILTARSEVALRVRGLDAGADDYLAKPFVVAELRARVRALGRRTSGAPAASVRALRIVRGDLVLDFSKRRAMRGEAEVPVTARQWAILELLASRGGQVVSRGTLLEQVWGEVTDANASSLEVLVARLRRKLGAKIIRTLRGEGYAFEGEP